MIEGGRAVNHVEHNEDDLSLGPLSSEVPPHAPMLLLSEDGTIQGLTNGARRLLEHPPDASIEPCFFAHVHGQNLRRVMQDLARMATRRKGPGGSCACGPEMVGGAGIGRGPSASPVPQTTAFACASVAYDGTLVRILSFVEGNGDRLVVLEREAEERSPGR